MVKRAQSPLLPAFKHGGFTLIEVLVVLVIAGISVAAVSLSLGVADESRKLEQQSRQLLNWFEHIQRDAVINHATYAIDFSGSADVLSVSIYSDGEWTPVENNLETYHLNEGTVIELHSYEDGLEEEDIDSIRFYPNMQYSPFRIFLKGSATGQQKITRDGTEPLVQEDTETAS